MFSNWLLLSVSVGYVGLLFVIAYLGERFHHRLGAATQRQLYALSLGVYCTSWGFLGTAGQAAWGDYSYLPVYLAPILLFLFAWPLIQRIIRVSLRLNITSIADLLSARFGKSRHLAVLITLVALVGTLPYIALQLKAIVGSYTLLRQDAWLAPWQLGLVVSAFLIGFTIMFGTRTIDVTERHPGLMVAIAFESLLKLVAYLLIGLFVCFGLFDSPLAIWRRVEEDLPTLLTLGNADLVSMLGLTLVVGFAFLCLPRQFQTTMVELRDPDKSRSSRWLFPLYLMVFALLAAPMGWAGRLLYGDTLAADAYVLFLPALQGNAALSLLSFLGAISAASAMVIISTMALSIMLSNELVFPALFRRRNLEQTQFQQFRIQLLRVRKALVITVILLAYGLVLIAPAHTMASLGQVSFGALAQIGPPLLAAFLWRRVTHTGVICGIGAGFSLWIVLILAPQLDLFPHPLHGFAMAPSTLATLLALGVNALLMILVSILRRPSVKEQLQLAHFFPHSRAASDRRGQRPLDPTELAMLANRFVGESLAREAFAAFPADDDGEALRRHTEQLLGSELGSASARLVLLAAQTGGRITLDDVADLVAQASSNREALSQALLQRAIENASEGISVTDHNQRLVAWNDRYLKLFQYPDHLIYPGCPVADLIAFNLGKTLDDEAEIRQQVERRLGYLRQGSRHSSERQFPDGTIVRIEGNPMPGGGFVMLFTDITVYREAEALLTEKNLDLEQLVSERSDKLAKANAQLARSNVQLANAHRQAEAAHRQKSQYLKACSHDLLQPLSAARLFSSTLLEERQLPPEQRTQLARIDRSLQVANELLLDLNAIARLESGTIEPKIAPFPLQSLFDSLTEEFSALAPAHKLRLRCVATDLWVLSDRQLLRRILQNLLSNALRYAAGGSVLLGCRRGQGVTIEVIDNGPGIPRAKQEMVFEQFTRLDDTGSAPAGLGLGLNIARGLAQLLGHPFTLESDLGRGCHFRLAVPQAAANPKVERVQPDPLTLRGIRVLVVDNDPEVLAGMTALLQQWQCEVMAAKDLAGARRWQARRDIDIMLVDYQLDRGAEGLTLMRTLQAHAQRPLPGILISATTDERVVNSARAEGFGFLRKLIKPAALRAMMSAQLVKQWKANYVSQSPSEGPAGRSQPEFGSAPPA